MKQEPGNASSQESPGFSRGEEVNQNDHQDRPDNAEENAVTVGRSVPLQEHAHWRCDCVPDLGPAHCHRCSRIAGQAVAWEEAGCSDYTQRALIAVNNALAIRPRLEGQALADEAVALMVDLLIDQGAPESKPREPKQTAQKAQEAQEPTPVPEPASAPVAAPVAAQEPRPTPAFVPKAPAEKLISAAEAHTSKEPPAPWRLTNLAREQAASFDLTPREAVEMVEAATVRHRTPRGGVNHYCEDLLILVDENGECIISIVKRDEVLYEDSHEPRKPHGNTSAQRGKSGGPGRRNPSSAKEMLALLKEHGFEYKLGSKGHYLAKHPDHPKEQFSIPATPSDKRSLQNCVSHIKRRTGIDVTMRADGHN